MKYHDLLSIMTSCHWSLPQQFTVSAFHAIYTEKNDPHTHTRRGKDLEMVEETQIFLWKIKKRVKMRG